jgi:hypothetical protein
VANVLPKSGDVQSNCLVRGEVELEDESPDPPAPTSDHKPDECVSGTCFERNSVEVEVFLDRVSNHTHDVDQGTTHSDNVADDDARHRGDKRSEGTDTDSEM